MFASVAIFCVMATAAITSSTNRHETQVDFKQTADRHTNTYIYIFIYIYIRLSRFLGHLPNFCSHLNSGAHSQKNELSKISAP